MKYKKILRLLGVITVVTLLLMAVVPALPVLGAIVLTLNPTTVAVGGQVTYSGSGYSSFSESLDYHIDIYITDTSGLNLNIDNTITRYKLITSPSINTDGTFSGTFTLPSIIDQGTTGIATPITLTAGTTYYIGITNRYADLATVHTLIQAIAPITIKASAALNALSVTSGPAGTSVTVSGSGFLPSYPVIIGLDTTPISSNTVTDTSGSFTSTITIPSSTTAGAHNISVTVGTTIFTTPFTVTASATLNALVPTSGAAGSSVTVSGSNFSPSYPIIFYFDSTSTPLNPATGVVSTDINGNFSAALTIPSAATATTHKIYVMVGTVTLNKDFTVTGAPPPTTTPPPTTAPPTTAPPTTTPPATGKAVLSINQSGHSIGATIGIGGAGFAPGANVTIKYDTTVVASVKAETNGTFISPFFTAPPSVHGDHIITATDGVNTTTTKFTVESTAPKVPPPLKPELGAKAKSPVTFVWTNVTDDSMPVTYRLQVATNNTFATGTLVLDKTGLTGSPYMMTQIEELKLAGTADTPYYWRIQSIDAASNESAWTGASVFYIPGPFKFPSWAIYVGGAVGALIFFLIGLFIGRRTAFMY